MKCALDFWLRRLGSFDRAPSGKQPATAAQAAVDKTVVMTSVIRRYQACGTPFFRAVLWFYPRPVLFVFA